MTEKTGRRRTTKKASGKASDTPTGTVTFLFTDIEGSTALWEDYPIQMEAALARHDQIMREIIKEHGGHDQRLMLPVLRL